MKYAEVKRLFVFDVESIGLHGEGFAVAWVIVDRIKDGWGEVAAGIASCRRNVADGSNEDRSWVRENIPDIVGGAVYSSPRAVRSAFWREWVMRSDVVDGSILMVADCPWPVEARFLAACVDDDPASRKWGGPYPLIDVGAVRLAAGLDPLGTEGRMINEMPVHCPLGDARQSARLFIEAMDMLDRDSGGPPFDGKINLGEDTA